MTAKIIAHSVGQDAPELASLELRYWKGIHGEFMTHRVFSRNARSSRAVPAPRLIEEVATNPFVPKHWGVNQKGMQAGLEHNALVVLREQVPSLGSRVPRFSVREVSREAAWLTARDAAVKVATALHEAGYHKQVVNRILEPFMFIDVLVTATEWKNFFALRDDPMAEPHIRDLAVEMREAIAESTPVLLREGDWHLPYVDPHDDAEAVYEHCIKQRENPGFVSRAVSVTRCARISYKPFHGESGDIAAEVERHGALVSARPMHASPTEHQATPDMMRGVRMEGPNWCRPDLHGNLRGWRQYRKMLEGESVPG